MQPTDMHSLLLQPQPQLLQPLQPLTATGTYRARAGRLFDALSIGPAAAPPSSVTASELPLVPEPPGMPAPRPSLFLSSLLFCLFTAVITAHRLLPPLTPSLPCYRSTSGFPVTAPGDRDREAFSICHFPSEESKSAAQSLQFQ